MLELGNYFYFCKRFTYNEKNNVTLYLDWTPNINHIGFFVAKELGFYSDLEMRVDILDPSIDNYKVTPAKKVELGQSDFALCPFESVISYRTKDKPFDLTAIAAILQKDLSAIAVIDSNIRSPKYLDSKTYASYGARYEDLIVKQMIINDGGKGTIDIKYPEKLGIWETLISKKHDSTWIFLNWEGIEAKNKKVNIELIPNDLGQNLDLEKWSLNKAILLVKKIKDVDINIL